VVSTASSLAGGNVPSTTEGGAAVGVAAPTATTLSGYQAATYATGSPSNVSTLIASDANVKAVFEASGATTYGVVDIGNQSRSNTSAQETFDDNVAFSLNTTGLTAQHLDLGLFGISTTAGSGGFDKIVFAISVGGAPVVSDTLTSLAALGSLNDSVIDLGARADSTALLVDLSVAYTSTGGGDGFDGNIIFGNAAAQPAAPGAVPELKGAAPLSAPNPQVPEPSTWLLLVVGAGAALLGRRRRSGV